MMLTRACSRRWLSGGSRWQPPSGFDTGVQIYNTAARAKVPLVLQQPNLLKWYMCGPTVYDSAHVGHAVCYVRQDIIRRILNGHFHIDCLVGMNITDIDDKIIRKAHMTNMEPAYLAKHFENEFLHDLAALRVLPPTMIVRATDFIPQMVDMIQQLLDKGLAYKSSDGSVYFDAAKYSRFGMLCPSPSAASVDADESPAQRKAAEAVKRSARDFALWKGRKPAEPYWEAPFGAGRPGWHIECSAMATSMFGSKIDIHSGGVDLMFPHHENTVAQTQSCYDLDQWVNYWIHVGHVHGLAAAPTSAPTAAPAAASEQPKMSRSLGNVISIERLLQQYSADQFRLFCLLTDFHRPTEFSAEQMKQAGQLLDRFTDFMHLSESCRTGMYDWSQLSEPDTMQRLQACRTEVDAALRDDFDTPRAVAGLHALVNFCYQSIRPADGRCASSHVNNYAPVMSVAHFVEVTFRHFGLKISSRQQMLKDDNARVLGNVLDCVTRFRNDIRIYALTHGAQATGRKSAAKAAGEEQQGGESRVGGSALDEAPAGVAADSDATYGRLMLNWTQSGSRAPPPAPCLAPHQIDYIVRCCDQLRDQLFLTGVQIKDQKRTSSWVYLQPGQQHNDALRQRQSALSGASTKYGSH